MKRIEFSLQKFALILAVVSLVAACATRAPDSSEDRSVAERVRAPAPEEPRGLQVYPLRNPAVAELIEAAERAWKDDDLERATLLLERALRIEPRDPELLQHMADVKFASQDWEQAESYANRSFDVGPRVGELCRRNWRTIAVAREQLGYRQSALLARERLETCQVEPPPRY